MSLCTCTLHTLSLTVLQRVQWACVPVGVYVSGRVCASGRVSLGVYASGYVLIDSFGVLTCRDLASKDGKVDPYATISYGGKELSTPVLRKTRFPRWNKTYEIPIKKPITDSNNRTLKVCIYNGEKFHHQRFLGEVT